MMPIMRAIELEVPVIGRSYSPAFLGWFSAICNSFVRDYRCSSYTLGTLAFYACGTVICATGHRNWCNEKAILMPNFSLLLVKQSFVSLSRGEIHTKWQRKRYAARQDDTPYFRMMDNSSHSERKRSSEISALRGIIAVVCSDVNWGDCVRRTW
jgi:hypothetical protein